MYGIGIAHGKFGELLQGVLPDKDTDFLVTIPISRFSTAKFRYHASLNKAAIVYPSHKIKSTVLTQKIMKYFGLTGGWTLIIESELGEGKGLGSSTADMVACARAITQATGKHLPIEIFHKFLREIEPSDGVMHDGVVCFYHRHVALHSQLGYLSNIMIVGVDEGGMVDTIHFNKKQQSRSKQEKLEYMSLLDEMIDAINKNDLKKIGSIATRSAVLHQALLSKKNLFFLIELSKEVNALGVLVAHSGTYIGIMLDKDDPDYLLKLVFIERKMKESLLMPEQFDAISKSSRSLIQDKTG